MPLRQIESATDARHYLVTVEDTICLCAVARELRTASAVFDAGGIGLYFRTRQPLVAFVRNGRLDWVLFRQVAGI
jgi:hypothetical protein